MPRLKKPSTQLVKSNVQAEMNRISPIINVGALFNAPVADLSKEQRVAGWALLRKFEDLFKERKEQMRQGLFQDAEDQGTQNENGSLILEVEGSRVLKKRAVSKTPNMEKTQELLDRLGIPRDKVIKMKPVTKMEPVVDQSMLEAMVATGQLKQVDLDTLFDVKWSLSVEPSSEIEGLLDAVNNKMALPPSDPKSTKK